MSRVYHTVYDAIAEGGFTHMDTFCRMCRVRKMVPFRLMPGLKLGDKLVDLPRRMRCEKCGQGPEEASPWKQSYAKGYVTKPYG